MTLLKSNSAGTVIRLISPPTEKTYSFIAAGKINMLRPAFSEEIGIMYWAFPYAAI